MTEVLRRVQDLLVGDVVAHEGKARKVEEVREHPMSRMMSNGPVMFVIFEDSLQVEITKGPHVGETKKKPELFQMDYRFLLLESHYSAKEK